MKKAILRTQLLLVAVAVLLASTAHAAVPGITGATFNLTARPAFTSQPDGSLIYSWGYGCTSAPAGFAPRSGFGPATTQLANANCPDMQVPGPTLIVTAGTTFTVVLTNGLPNAAGNTSILFPGLQVQSTSGGVQGLLAQEAAPGGTVSYTVNVPGTAAGTHAYYSGTQGDLQIEMGLYGAVIVLPAASPACPQRNNAAGVNGTSLIANGEQDYRLATAAYNNSQACYEREYLFQFSEMDPRIHRQAEEQVQARANCAVGSLGCSLNVATEPYVPAYFLINGRSMPDLMDANYAPEYPHQPYNGNPHMHPGENVLIRVIGQGRWQHPFHEHGNHVRILGRDGNLITSASNSSLLAGPLLFTTSTTPGQAVDGIFYWTGKGLNWDAYGHHPSGANPNVPYACVPDANGYHTSNPLAINYYEWCQDHNKPLEKAPFGNVGTGGPVTLPDATILANGAWYGGSPYLGPEATQRAVGFTGSTPPSGTIANPPTEEAGFAYMWHSHNEREITTNNIFPGGMMMMMLVDSREFPIDESN